MNDDGENGGASGAANGDDNGGEKGSGKRKRRPILDFDAFCDAVRASIADLTDTVAVCETQENGRSVGPRIAKVALEPIDTIDDRVNAEVDGPKWVVLRTRSKAGQFHTTGLYKVPAPKKRVAGGESALVLEMLAEMRADNASLRAEVARLTAAAASPPEKLSEKVDSFDRLTSAVERMMPKAPPASAAAPAAPPTLLEQMKALKEAAAELGLRPGGGVGESVASKLIDSKIGEAAANILTAVGVMVADKADSSKKEKEGE